MKSIKRCLAVRLPRLFLFSIVVFFANDLIIAKELPGSIAPGQIEKRFKKPIEPLSSTDSTLIEISDDLQITEDLKNKKVTSQDTEDKENEVKIEVLPDD